VAAFKSDFRDYHRSLAEADKLLQIVVDTKYLEASTETFFQNVLQLLVVLAVALATRVEVTPGLETVFFKKFGIFLYISLAMSFVSMVNTR